MWLTAADKRVEYAEDIYTITEQNGDRVLELLCPTKHIRSRGDTLNCPTLTIKLEAEIDDVISLEVTHWAGAVRRGPNFELFPDGKPESTAKITKDADGTTLTSERLEVRVGSGPHSFDIQFRDAENGEMVTSLLNRSIGYAFSPPPGNAMETGDMRNFQHHVFTQTELGVGESIHGLGERFGAFNKVGQNVRIWNADG